jgi:UDP-glucose 4-epimerase
MKALVTGGSGFIGAEVVTRLLARGDRVAVLRRARSSPRRPDRLAGLASSRLDIITGDVTDPAALARASRGVEAVYHLAFTYRHAWRLGEDLLGPNLEATERVLQAAATAGARRFVVSSSVSVYGWNHPAWRWPLEEDTPLRGWGTYPETKIRTEALVRDFCRPHGIQPMLLRLPHVYGPGASTFDHFISGLLRGPLRAPRRAEVDPTLEWGRVWHWVHVHDAADAVVRAGVVNRHIHDAFNIAGETAITRAALRALVTRLAEEGERFGAEAAPYIVPRFQMYDIRRARRELGFTPRVDVVEGLRDKVRGLWRSFAA